MSSNVVFLQCCLNSFKSDITDERYSELDSKLKDIILSELEVLLCYAKENNLDYLNFRKIHICTIRTLLMYFREYQGWLSRDVLDLFEKFFI